MNLFSCVLSLLSSNEVQFSVLQFYCKLSQRKIFLPFAETFLHEGNTSTWNTAKVFLCQTLDLQFGSLR